MNNKEGHSISIFERIGQLIDYKKRLKKIIFIGISIPALAFLIVGLISAGELDNKPARNPVRDWQSTQVWEVNSRDLINLNATLANQAPNTDLETSKYSEYFCGYENPQLLRAINQCLIELTNPDGEVSSDCQEFSNAGDIDLEPVIKQLVVLRDSVQYEVAVLEDQINDDKGYPVCFDLKDEDCKDIQYLQSLLNEVKLILKAFALIDPYVRDVDKTNEAGSYEAILDESGEKIEKSEAEIRADWIIARSITKIINQNGLGLGCELQHDLRVDEITGEIVRIKQQLTPTPLPTATPVPPPFRVDQFVCQGGKTEDCFSPQEVELIYSQDYGCSPTAVEWLIKNFPNIVVNNQTAQELLIELNLACENLK